MKIMDSHRRTPAQNCAKHCYLLSGLVRCGHCVEAMHGNTHINVKGSVYHSYRCDKKHDKSCPNTEISQERLDEYVLRMLEENIFNEGIFHKLIDKMKSSYSERLKHYSDEVNRLKAKLPSLDTRKQSIIKAIAGGFIADDFKEEMARIDAEREQIQKRMSEIGNNIPSMQLDEQKLSAMLSELRTSIQGRCIIECKRFIKEFVEGVVVYDSRIDVIMKISHSIAEGCSYTITKTIARKFLPKPI